MAEIHVTPLGAGQDVGRSCIIASIGSKNIMLDCGMHMGYNDERRFPDFSYIVDGNLTDHIDCVIISHFHLDHCGALPFMTEMVGYNGPIYMTHPTKAIAPILLEDMRKVAVERKGETNFFTSAMIKDCMKKVIAVNLHQVVQVDNEIEIKAYYAGHVLGGAMFHIKVGTQSLVYTGDYNMTPDRHLGAAWIDRCRPDLLISESTYATTIRDSKRCRERDFLKKVHECVNNGGKVLIPVFALGRAQELCILLETYWERMDLKVPIYFAAGLTEKANSYYKMFISWTNQKIKKTFVRRNMFEFKHIKPFDKSYIDNPGPMVVFATPGMLHAGLSLTIFKKWAPFEQNMLIMPGYCVQGTVGAQVLGGAKKIEIDRQTVEVKLSVEELGIDCFMPANGETAVIKTALPVHAVIDQGLLMKCKQKYEMNPPDPKRPCLVHGVLVVKDDVLTLMDSQKAADELGLPKQELILSCPVPLPDDSQPATALAKISNKVQKDLVNWEVVTRRDDSFCVQSVDVSLRQKDQSAKFEILVKWLYEDDELGNYILKMVKSVLEE